MMRDPLPLQDLADPHARALTVLGAHDVAAQLQTE